MGGDGFLRIGDVTALPGRLRGAVAAIGNFDGVHRGHRAVLDTALGAARQAGRPALAMTFEPHPRSVFRPDSPVFRLTPAPLRARILKTLGFDAVIEQPFSREFATIDAAVFVETILMAGLDIAHAVVGYDFHYGHGRRGTPATLREAGAAHGFGTTLVTAFEAEDGQIVTSTRIRRQLAEGDVAGAAGLLGYRYTVEATVSNGRRLGRTLGFPTANMALPEQAGLAHGIYAVRFTRADGSVHDGVASFGRRPTVDEDGRPLLETFLFDFDGNLYGETCAVSLFGFLRGEEKFDGLEALTEQMQRDAEEARALLSGVRPLSEIDAALAFGDGG